MSVLQIMRENWNTMIEGTKVILVPYRRAHVDKYHGWMKSKELQELTGSEPLTLGEVETHYMSEGLKSALYSLLPLRVMPEEVDT